MPHTTRRASRLLWAGLAVCVLVLLLTGAAARAGDEDELIVLNIGQEIEMEPFLRTASMASRRPMIWDPSNKNIRGKKIIGGTFVATPRAELWNTIRSLLTFYELELVPVGPKGHQVWLVMNARRNPMLVSRKPTLVRLTDENLAWYEHNVGMYVTTVIHVEHLEQLAVARNGLTRIVTGQGIGYASEIPAARAFLVTDFAPRVVACYRLIKAMDGPQGKPSTTKGRTVAVALKRARATELARTLKQHFPDQRITADARSNRLLVTGTDAEVKVLQEAAALLDVRVVTPQVRMHVVPVKHLDAAEAAGALNALVQGAPALWSHTRIVAHGKTLLVAATAKEHARLLGLIQDLDRAP